MDSESLKVTDEQAAAVAVAPRVSLAQIESAIAHKYEFVAGTMIAALPYTAPPELRGQLMQSDVPRSLRALSVCIVVLKNGFVVIGKSAPASEANFDAELGRKFAYEDAVRQIWPLAGFALREIMHGGMFANLARSSYPPPAPAMPSDEPGNATQMPGSGDIA